LGHTPLDIVQIRVSELPAGRPVTPEVFEPGVVIDVDPVAVHNPVPITGALPAKVAVVPQTVWSGPALAVVGLWSEVMITESTELGHTPLLIVQISVSELPAGNPVTPDEGELEVVIDVDPNAVQFPVPMVGVFPARVAVVAQTDWSGPALAVVGFWSEVMITESCESGHTPLEIVQISVSELPAGNPVTPEVADVGVVIEVDPNAVHKPDPMAGTLPANVAVVPQTVWSGPALAMVGFWSDVMITESTEFGQTPLLIVHIKVSELPAGRPVTPEVAEEGVVIDVEPVAVQVPVPMTGALPASVAVVAQTAWSGPAVATVGF